jgi:hypothetical protein
MKFYPQISFSEIDLQLDALFDSTPPFSENASRNYYAQHTADASEEFRSLCDPRVS